MTQANQQRHPGERHMYFNDRGLDLQKMKADALRLSKGDGRNEAIKVVIHHHEYLKPCDDKEHDVYEKVVEED